MSTPAPHTVLVFSGLDPSGGAGMQADIPAITTVGAHPFTVATALTAQDNVTVYGVKAVDPEFIALQAKVITDRFRIDAVKLGIVGNRQNADIIARIIHGLRQKTPDLPVVFDPVLANSNGDGLSTDDPALALTPLYECATVITPNLNEAKRLCGAETSPEQQAEMLLARGCQHVLLKGGHGPDDQDVVNRWYAKDGQRDAWSWTRLPGDFHGSGCTLAAALSGYLAQKLSVRDAIIAAQRYCQTALEQAYALADGQRFPNRVHPFVKEIK